MICESVMILRQIRVWIVSLLLTWLASESGTAQLLRRDMPVGYHLICNPFQEDDQRIGSLLTDV